MLVSGTSSSPRPPPLLSFIVMPLLNHVLRKSTSLWTAAWPRSTVVALVFLSACTQQTAEHRADEVVAMDTAGIREVYATCSPPSKRVT